MRKREELTDPNSCMSRARDDEMTFVLLGRDAAAPAAVTAWIDERVRLGKNHYSDPQILEAYSWVETVLAEKETAAIRERYPKLLALARRVLEVFEGSKDPQELAMVAHAKEAVS